MQSNIINAATCLILMAFALLASFDINAPGLYMDSVNPDYIAAWLNRGGLNIPAWIYPDNYIFGNKYPILNSLYGGNLTGYISALWFRIFDFGLLQVRVLHIIYSVTLLFAVLWCLKCWKINRVISCIVLLVLALTPTYLFSARTQLYLQLFPAIFFISGLSILGKWYSDTPQNFNVNRLFVAGLLFGFSAFLYFVYMIYAIAVLFVIAIEYYKKNNLLRSIGLVAFGVAVGWLPYVYAHASILLNTGLGEYIKLILSLKQSYNIGTSEIFSILDNSKYLFNVLSIIVSGEVIDKLFFNGEIFPFGHGAYDYQINTVKYLIAWLYFLLLVVPASLLFIIHFVKTELVVKSEVASFTLLKFLTAIIALHLIFLCAIGSSLWAQHYVMVLPIYALAVASLFDASIKACLNIKLKKILWVFLIIISFFIIVFSLLNISSTFYGLKKTAGNSMYSDVINRTANELYSADDGTVLLFPQWGLWMGVVTILGPKFEIYEAPNIKQLQNSMDSEKLRNKKLFALVTNVSMLNLVSKESTFDLNPFLDFNNLELSESKIVCGTNNDDCIRIYYLKRN